MLEVPLSCPLLALLWNNALAAATPLVGSDPCAADGGGGGEALPSSRLLCSTHCRPAESFAPNS